MIQVPNKKGDVRARHSAHELPQLTCFGLGYSLGFS